MCVCVCVAKVKVKRMCWGEVRLELSMVVEQCAVCGGWGRLGEGEGEGGERESVCVC